MFLDWAKEHGGFKSVKFKRDIFPTANDRSIWDNLPNDLKHNIIKNAEEYIGYSWPAPKATDWLAFQRTGDRLAQEDYFFERRWIINALALAECVENKGRFLDDFINGILSVCEESFWGLSAHAGGNKTNYPLAMLASQDDPYVDIFAACTAADLSIAVNLLSDKISETAPQIIDRVKYEMKTRIIESIIKHADYEWMGLQNGRVNNWNPWICSNVITVMLLYCDDTVAFKNCLSRLFIAGEMYLRNYLPDGGCDEGPMYWGKSAGAFFEFLYQLYLSTDGEMNFFDKEIVKNMGKYISRVNIDGNFYVNFADGHSKTQHSAGTLFFFGKMTNNAELMTMGKNSLSHITSKRTRSSGEFRSTVMLFAELREVINYKEITEYETGSYLPDLEIVTAREKSDKSGLFFSIKGGNNDESGAHNHNDVGHFILYSSGTPLVIDPGTGVYSAKTFSTERYDIWTMQNNWHNTADINGAVQFASPDAKATNFKCEDTGGILNVSFNSEMAYEKQCNTNSFIRNACFNRNEGYLEIKDEFQFKKESGNFVTEHIILSEKPQISNGKVLVAAKDGTRFVIEFSKNAEPSVDFQYVAEDRSLSADWGKYVYRLNLDAKNLSKTATVNYKIKRI